MKQSIIYIIFGCLLMTGLVVAQSTITDILGTFKQVSTGNGTTEVFPQNQALKSTSTVSFVNVTASDSVNANDIRAVDKAYLPWVISDFINVAGTGHWINASDILSKRIRSFNNYLNIGASGLNVSTLFPLLYGAGGYFSGNLTVEAIDTGNGNTEIFDMNQDMKSTDGVTFLTISTGNGTNELMQMNQDVLTSSNVTFDGFTSSKINTGQGWTEAYKQNQNLLTTSSPSFVNVTITNCIPFNNGAKICGI